MPFALKAVGQLAASALLAVAFAQDDPGEPQSGLVDGEAGLASRRQALLTARVASTSNDSPGGLVQRPHKADVLQLRLVLTGTLRCRAAKAKSKPHRNLSKYKKRRPPFWKLPLSSSAFLQTAPYLPSRVLKDRAFLH